VGDSQLAEKSSYWNRHALDEAAQWQTYVSLATQRGIAFNTDGRLRLIALELRVEERMWRRAAHICLMFLMSIVIIMS
jgi:hypothetical protein